MLTIRLTRKGKKNQPFFRVVVVDKRRSSKGGRAVEDLGYVDPLAKRRNINAERAKYWVSVGAQPSATVHNLLVSEKIIEAKKIAITNVSKAAKQKVLDEAAAKAKAEADAKAAEEQKKAEAEAAAKAAEEAAAAPAPEPASETPAEPTPEEKPAE